MQTIMKSMKLLSVLVLLGFFSFTTKAQSKQEAKVATAVEKLIKGMESGEQAALESITSDDLSYGHSGGGVETKEEFVKAFTSGKSDFVTIKISEQTIKVHGKTAIVRHKLDAETNDAGKGPAQVHIRVMTVWVNEKGEWKLLARQAVKTT